MPATAMLWVYPIPQTPLKLLSVSEVDVMELRGTFAWWLFILHCVIVMEPFILAVEFDLDIFSFNGY
jgi:hypothetical protein